MLNVLNLDQEPAQKHKLVNGKLEIGYELVDVVLQQVVEAKFKLRAV